MGGGGMLVGPGDFRRPPGRAPRGMVPGARFDPIGFVLFAFGTLL